MGKQTVSAITETQECVSFACLNFIHIKCFAIQRHKLALCLRRSLKIQFINHLSQKSEKDIFHRHITFDAHSRKNNLNSLDGSLVLKVLPFP